MSQKSYDGSGSLYLIPTPIGNMDDMTKRSVDTLNKVDLLLCEDTRITGLLLKNLSISKQLINSNEFTEEKNISLVLELLEKGKDVGLVTDRGTPVISDPGYRVVCAVADHGFNVVPLPGANALIPALIASGITPSPFLFYGFLSSKQSKRSIELEELKRYRCTLIFYEAPHRILKFLEELLEIFGNRKIAVSREISKIHEEIYRGTINSVLIELKEQKIKGEFVVVVEGNLEISDYSHISIQEHVNMYLDEEITLKEAMKIVAKERHISKSEVYKNYVTKE